MIGSIDPFDFRRNARKVLRMNGWRLRFAPRQGGVRAAANELPSA
jgi:hypothetical protein